LELEWFTRAAVLAEIAVQFQEVPTGTFTVFPFGLFVQFGQSGNSLLRIAVIGWDPVGQTVEQRDSQNRRYQQYNNRPANVPANFHNSLGSERRAGCQQQLWRLPSVLAYNETIVPMPKPDLKREHLHLTGQVQGVGFRPYAWRLAAAEGLSGFVINDASGATIEVQGSADAIDRFIRRLPAELPPLGQVHECRRKNLPLRPDEKNFEIRSSAGGELADAQVTPDTATCADCLAELFDKSDPRDRYPFINCTNCGPRYSIIERIPYDRPNTTMADFAMCDLCSRQYSSPADRRFHAQPIACPKCGPTCSLIDNQGREISCEDPIAEAAKLILAGRIVAIKGLGGFHLACRADDNHAVNRLRFRKGRDAKPFALMIRNLAQAHQLCEFDAAVEDVLTGPVRPICLLPRRSDAPVAESVAPGLPTLGIMLPYTPLHHLLFSFDLPALVMTSGNVSDEPLIKDNADAVAHLGQIADAILLHDRRIARSIDDSVVQVGRDGSSVLRRARGYAPRPVRLTGNNENTPAILAVGAELKNTICIYRNGRAVISEHIGDLKDGRVYRHFMGVIGDIEALFDLGPEVIVADMHPQYLSTEYAIRRAAGELSGRPAVPLLRVQHHHAHVVSCLAEHGRSDEVIGIVCDGTGYGTDGAVWGCEIMRASPARFERLGHLRYFNLPGGNAAAIETARPAASLLWETFGKDFAKMPVAERLGVDGRQIAEQLSAGVNCPQSSSLGRMFDAVAGMCGLAERNRYEGEAPMLAEGAITDGVRDEYPFTLTETDPFEIDYRPMIEGIVRDITAGVTVGIISAKFHNTVATFLAASARRVREITGLKTSALSGGCFANQYLTRRLTNLLRADGFEVLTHREIPCNDGGIALGQAVIAAHLNAGLEGV
jgi:hydrogenase maturation protein HypF